MVHRKQRPRRQRSTAHLQMVLEKRNPTLDSALREFTTRPKANYEDYNNREKMYEIGKKNRELTEQLTKEINAHINSSDPTIDKAIYEILHAEDGELQKDPEYVILYHGTSFENAQLILDEGLIGGDNTSGGTHGTWGEPVLFVAPSQETAEKYGNTLLEIKIPLREYWKNYHSTVDIINDGLGDRVYTWTAKDVAGEDWQFDTVIIPSEYITEIDRSDYFPDD